MKSATFNLDNISSNWLVDYEPSNPHTFEMLRRCQSHVFVREREHLLVEEGISSFIQFRYETNLTLYWMDGERFAEVIRSQGHSVMTCHCSKKHAIFGSNNEDTLMLIKLLFDPNNLLNPE